MKNKITFVQQRASESQGTTLGMGNSIHLNLKFVLEISLQGSDECNLSREGARGLAWGHSSSMAEQVKEWTLLLKFHHLPSPFLPLERKISALLFAVAVPEKIISGFFSILGDGISGHPDMISLFWCWCGASWPQLQLLQIMSWR